MIHFFVAGMNILSIFLLVFVIRLREYKSVAVMFYVPVLIVFWAPILYIYIGGSSYVKFGASSYLLYILTSYVAIFSSFVFIISRKSFSSGKHEVSEFHCSRKSNPLVSFYLISFMFFCLAVLLYYWDSWPFLKALSGSIVVRPDIAHGDFESYFLISVIFQVCVPFAYIYFYPFIKSKSLLNIALFSFVCFFLVAGGNKAVLFFFFIFCLLFLFKGFSAFRLLFFLLASFFFYFLMKGGVANYGAIYSIGESALRRLFVTQGMGVPNAFELHLAGLDFSNYSSNEIKSLVFEHVYGYLPGSMPVFFIPEAYMRWGWLALFLSSVSIPMLLALFSVFIEKWKDLAVGWVYYYFVYAFVMSGFSLSNGYRLIFCVLFVLGYFLCKITRFKESPHSVSQCS